MNQEHQRIFDRVHEIATIAGFNLHTVEEGHPMAGLPAAGFDLGGGRSQRVFIRPAGTTPDGHDVVTFVSPCLHVKTGFLSGISREQALDLLQRNENLYFARFGIWRLDKADMIVASCDQILDTMEAQEFAALVQSVAVAADAYEREHSKEDLF
jgi:hypothetical protein